MEVAAARRRGRVGDLALQDDARASSAARGIGLGIADRSADGVRVLREANSVSRLAISTIWPTYITATRSLMCLTTLRSWATNR